MDVELTRNSDSLIIQLKPGSAEESFQLEQYYSSLQQVTLTGPGGKLLIKLDGTIEEDAEGEDPYIASRDVWGDPAADE